MNKELVDWTKLSQPMIVGVGDDAYLGQYDKASKELTNAMHIETLEAFEWADLKNYLKNAYLGRLNTLSFSGDFGVVIKELDSVSATRWNNLRVEFQQHLDYSIKKLEVKDWTPSL